MSDDNAEKFIQAIRLIPVEQILQDMRRAIDEYVLNYSEMNKHKLLQVAFAVQMKLTDIPLEVVKDDWDKIRKFDEKQKEIDKVLKGKN